MATLKQCDGCGTKTEAKAALVSRWALLKIHKLDDSHVEGAFELCESCIGVVRGAIARITPSQATENFK